MNYIPCADNCLYQSDGICTLDHCAAAGQPSLAHPCVHYQPISSSPETAVPGQYSAPEAASDGTSP